MASKGQKYWHRLCGSNRCSGNNAQVPQGLAVPRQPISLTSALIERAAESTRSWLAEGGLDRREDPQQMHAHKHSR
jgi:hypothetical protein